MVRIGVVIPARNEAQTLPYTLLSLQLQSLKPSVIVVVDDDSDDNTAEVAKSFGAKVIKLKRSFKHSATGTPYLAYVINRGFEILENFDLDFVMISGAECIYPKDYIEKLVNHMVKDRVVLASGVAVGEYSTFLGVRGAGRLILASWFKKIGFRYPLNYGYETWLIYKALQHGLKVKVYRDVKFYLLRRTRFNEVKAYLYGKAMKALGYPAIITLIRALYLSFIKRNNRIFANMVRGFYHPDVEMYDIHIRQIVKKSQLSRLVLPRL